MILLLLLQAVAGPVLPAAPRPRAATPCPTSADTADVIVCAPDQEGYRLRAVPPRYERSRGLPKAETTVLGNARLAAEVEQGADAQGGPINRAMVRLKIPLGGRKTPPSP